jgi:uncharacterized membrane protein
MKIQARKFLRYFFNGTLFIVPLIATIYTFVFSFQWLDSQLGIPYPGVGFVIIVSVITIFGYFTTNFAFDTIASWFDGFINRIPLVKLIYSSVKDLIEAFVGEKKKFNKPVLVTIDRANNINRIGFITQQDLSELGLNDMVVVYIPQSYAFAGDHFVVPNENVKHLNIPGAMAMKFVVSGGVSGFSDT